MWAASVGFPLTDRHSMGNEMLLLTHSAAPHHPPAFIAAPGETDALLVVMGVF